MGSSLACLLVEQAQIELNIKLNLKGSLVAHSFDTPSPTCVIYKVIFLSLFENYFVKFFLMNPRMSVSVEKKKRHKSWQIINYSYIINFILLVHVKHVDMIKDQLSFN